MLCVASGQSKVPLRGDLGQGPRHLSVHLIMRRVIHSTLYERHSDALKPATGTTAYVRIKAMRSAFYVGKDKREVDAKAAELFRSLC